MEDREHRLARALRGARLRIAELESAAAEPIAVVGMGCRFPGGVEGPDAYWERLVEGRDAIAAVPADRWDVDEWGERGLYSQHGAFLEDIAAFDAGLFGIGRREAVSMDPQQRLLLEVSWLAIEHAGLAPDILRGSSTGVIAGVCFDDYARLGPLSGDPDQVDALSSLGTARSVAVGRVAYQFDLRGPVLQLDTTCSSSLLAIHLAARALQARECDLMLAGGVNAILCPEISLAFCRMGALSRAGRCRTFDAGADGYVRGEGCGIVVLERLVDAQRHGHDIWCTIGGSSVNHDGRSNGLTAPNGSAQTDVIRAALGDARLAPEDVQVLEAHGTGTPLGDPIEIHAAARALKADQPRERQLLIGSVKSNMGHLEAAAGVAGAIKSILALHHGVVPPHLHFRRPNPTVRWSDLAIEVPVGASPWPVEGDVVRRAGVSSFGMSGTNVHIIFERDAKVSAVDAARTPVRHTFSRERYWIDGARRTSGQRKTANEALTDKVLSELSALVPGLPTPIDFRTPLVELGLDSLGVVELSAALKRVTGTHLNESALLAPDSNIASLLETLRHEEGSAPATLNLAEEAVLPADIVSARLADRQRRERHVLVTGGTGFFGCHLIEALLRNPDATVWCLVRAANSIAAAARLADAARSFGLEIDLATDRLRVVPGDTALPLMGLSRADYDGLVSQGTDVYHSAAELSYISPYAKLAPTNVGGTLEMLRLVARSGAHLHLMSSVAVFESTAYRGRDVDEATDPVDWEGIPIGYSQSKWVAERLVSAAGARGLPVSIHRLPLLSGHSRTGAWAGGNLVCMILAGCRQVGIIPFDLDVLVDFAPVDLAAADIVALTTRIGELPLTSHLVHPHPMHWSEVVTIVRHWGKPMEPVPFGRWRQLIAPQGPLGPLLPLLTNEIPDTGGRTYLELQERELRARIQCEQTRKLLSAMGIGDPPGGRELWGLYGEWFERMDW